MKKYLILLMTLLSPFVLTAGVLDLFYPDVSYMECSQFSYKTIEGEFSFDDVPALSRTVISEKTKSYSFFEKGRHSFYALDSSKSFVWLVMNTSIYKGSISSLSVGCIDYYPSEFDEDGGISDNYQIVREDDAKLVLSSVDSQDRILIEYELFDTYARKIVYKNNVVLFCHWITSWREIDGARIPGDECFFLSNLFYSGRIVFKESRNISGQGLFYGPFNIEKLKEILEKCKGDKRV